MTSDEKSDDFPIVDPHQHFWDLDRNYYPWLCDSRPVPFRYGDYTSLKEGDRLAERLRSLIDDRVEHARTIAALAAAEAEGRLGEYVNSQGLTLDRVAPVLVDLHRGDASRVARPDPRSDGRKAPSVRRGWVAERIEGRPMVDVEILMSADELKALIGELTQLQQAALHRGPYRGPLRRAGGRPDDLLVRRAGCRPFVERGEVRHRHLDAHLDRLRGRRLHDLHRPGAGQERRDLVQRPDRGGQPDPLRRRSVIARMGAEPVPVQIIISDEAAWFGIR